jgi:hypothetical protein
MSKKIKNFMETENKIVPNLDQSFCGNSFSLLLDGSFQLQNVVGIFLKHPILSSPPSIPTENNRKGISVVGLMAMKIHPQIVQDISLTGLCS